MLRQLSTLPLEVLRFSCVVAAAFTATLAHGEVSVRDDAGKQVTLARPAQRIVSLAPHATEMLFAAGAGAAVVGAVARSDWPAEARAIPRIGDANALDLERIVALAPDLVVAWPYTVPAHLAVLRKRNVQVFVSDPRTIAGIAGGIERLAMLAGTSAAARPAVEAFRARYELLLARHRSAAPLRVFYEVWNEPLYTIGGRHLISEAIGLCGGENVFAALTLPAPSVTVEAVIAARPDVIVGGDDDGLRPPWLDAWRRWPTLPAVRDGNLIAADGNLLHRPGPRFIEGVATLCAEFEQARSRRSRDAATREGTPRHGDAGRPPAPVRTVPRASAP
jgi:iron complex transport system substrate-binding protein